ncbi:MAG TPA: single-stranded DNA-binding protein [Pseudomonadales bacterium]|nr:single-stranded DNA-binding protein [Pseudomonadales bacterium]
MYQQITLIGNLGTDPELRFTPSGVPVASFSLAVNRSWTGQDGQKQDKTTWFRISVWQKQAESVAQYLAKGRQVLVIGEMEDARAFTDKDGNQRASLEVRAQSVKFLGQKGDTQHANDAASLDRAVETSEDLPF